MIEPSIDTLLERVDSKYTLVVLAAKRSRELVGQTVVESIKSTKPVTISLHEIAKGNITYERIKTITQ